MTYQTFVDVLEVYACDNLGDLSDFSNKLCRNQEMNCFMFACDRMSVEDYKIFGDMLHSTYERYAEHGYNRGFLEGTKFILSMMAR